MAILLVVFALLITTALFTVERPLLANLYLAIQTVLIIIGFTSVPEQAHNIQILFFILSAQAMLILPIKIAGLWIIAYSVITVVGGGLIFGWALMLQRMASVGGYIFFGLFGAMQRRSIAAQQESQRLLGELQETYEQLQVASKQAQQLAVSEERNRLARELHDSLGHRLTVAIVQLEGARRLIPSAPERAGNMVESMRLQLKESLAELRQAVSTLRSPQDKLNVIDDLKTAVSDLVHTFRRRNRACPSISQLTPTSPTCRNHIAAPSTAPRKNRSPTCSATPTPPKFGSRFIRKMAALHSQQQMMVKDIQRWWKTAVSASKAYAKEQKRSKVPSNSQRVAVAVHNSNSPSPAHKRRSHTLPDKIRILLVDDQRLMRDGLRILLELEPDLIVQDEAVNGQEAVDKYEQGQPDVVLMDIRMPIMDGVAATQQVKAQWPHAKILILTTFDDDNYLFDALRAGAMGYLLKDASGEELATAVRTIAAGGALMGPSVAEKVMAQFVGGKTASTSPKSQLPDPLSEREQQILQLIAQGMSNPKIADKLHLAEGTVKNYVSSILQKTNTQDRTQAVLKAQSLGLL